MKSEAEKLTDLYNKKKKEGLLYIIPILSKSAKSSTVEEVCGVINRLYENVEKGNCIIIEKFGDLKIINQI